MLTSDLPFFAANLSEFPRKSPTVVSYWLFSSKFTAPFHATLQSAYISKGKHLFVKFTRDYGTIRQVQHW